MSITEKDVEYCQKHNKIKMDGDESWRDVCATCIEILVHCQSFIIIAANCQECEEEES